ncbi:dynamin family protein [Saccharopolyspora shandongensis]|uniref:dynamin family protein n=1 Tax=Saccharopolyspora shandongensis TaxID=418495 RepID=UPI0033D8E9DC
MTRNAIAAHAGTPAEPLLKALAVRLRQPLRVAIAGKVKAGKSTLLNALLGEALAATDAGECTKILTWFQHGSNYRVLLQPHQATAVEARFSRDDGGPIQIDLGGLGPADVDRLVVEWPSTTLKNFVLIDTPGIGSVASEVSDRANRFLVPDEGRATPADAVLYLMRHRHRDDMRLLEAFHDDEVVQPTPVNAVGVLSRADEIGGGKTDSTATAAKIAASYRHDPGLHRVCQTVLPVAGLLAFTGRTLREQEYTAMHRIAGADREPLAAALSSVDRFAEWEGVEDVSAEERRRLLDRFGLFGLRLAVELIRAGRCTNSAQLAAHLIEQSGLRQLVTVLGTQFAARSDVLKARSVLMALGTVLQQLPDATRLQGEVERIWAGAHEIAELRLLNSLRLDPAGLAAEEVEEAERLLGSAGTAPIARLGLEPDADDAEITRAARSALDRWQKRAESPLSLRSTVHAARVLLRSSESLLAQESDG